MKYKTYYQSPLGEIMLACDDAGLTGLWFDGQKYYGAGLSENAVSAETAVFAEVRRWLDIYFAGGQPAFIPKLHLCGTEFQVRVWEQLLRIPYGSVTTYGRLADKLSGNSGAGGMAARAVGSAVGHNRISLIVPCHRVLGADGSLTGYAGGTERKSALLLLEGIKVG